MVMRFLVVTLALVASPAWARIAHPLPAPMEEAPVARAIENVERDETLAPAQRERLLGRLHLIAYAQANARLTHYSNGEWQLDGRPPCGDAAYRNNDAPWRVCPSCGVATNELPEHAEFGAFARRSHLRQARRHYERSLALDDDNLRAELGLAYVLDELGETREARAHLRQIITLAQSRFRGSGDDEYLDWEDHAVLSEALDHLSVLARSRADREAIDALRPRMRADPIVVTATPIVIPLTDAPFDELIDPTSMVAFDIAGTGDLRAQGWLTPDAAWLVWDPHQRGDIRSGFDLIGQSTWAVFWTDGFEAMRSLDDNSDGELAGAELGGLALWRDANSNGVSEPGEAAPVESFGVAALAVGGVEDRPGLIVAPNGVRFADGTLRPLYDWSPGATGGPTS